MACLTLWSHTLTSSCSGGVGSSRTVRATRILSPSFSSFPGVGFLIREVRASTHTRVSQDVRPEMEMLLPDVGATYLRPRTEMLLPDATAERFQLPKGSLTCGCSCQSSTARPYG